MCDWSCIDRCLAGCVVWLWSNPCFCGCIDGRYWRFEGLGAEPSSQGNWKHVRRCIRHGDHSCTTLKFCDGLVQTTQVSAWCPMQVMATTALSVGDSFPMSKGGAFKLEIPMLLSLCVSVQRLSVFGSHWLDLLILVRSTLKLWNLSELEQVRLDVIMVWI